MRFGMLFWVVSLALVAGGSGVPAAAAGETYTGRVEVEHADDMDAGRSIDRVFLVAGAVRLAVEDRSLAALAGKRVTLSATRRGDALLDARVVQVGDAGGWERIPGFPKQPPRLGERRVAVLLVSIAADLGRRWDEAPLRDIMFGAGDSVDSYFRTGSAGQVSLAGDVHGWYTIGAYGQCDTTAILHQALAAARVDGVDFEDYHHVTVMFPRLPDCRFNGMGYLDGPWAWINGQVGDMRLLAHELGHNFGVHHAGAQSCTQGGAPVALSTECSFDEYGDPLDVMGHSQRNLFNVAHRLRLGWLAPEQSRTVRQDGAYELTSINRPGGGVKELLIPQPDPSNGSNQGVPRFLSLELRSALGRFDAFAPDDSAVTGLSVRRTYGSHGYIPLLLDLTPGSPGGHRDGQLGVGKAFTDPLSGTAIRLESIRDGVARIRVGAGERDGPVTPAARPEPDGAPPSPAVTRAPTVALDASRPSLRVRPAVPRGGRRLGRSRRISLQAVPATGVRLEARLDGRLLRAGRASRLALRLPQRVLRGRHVLELVAIDGAGRRAALRLRVVRGVLRH